MMKTLYSMFADHQIKHQATNEMGRQRGDCSWPHWVVYVLVSSLTYHCDPGG